MSVIIDIEEHGFVDVRDQLDGVQARAEHPGKKIMNVIGETGISSIQKTFVEEGRPEKWKTIGKAQRKKRKNMSLPKWPGRILFVRGYSGGLVGSIGHVAYDNSVVISANKKYKAFDADIAARLHFGDENMDARPYMVLQEEDVVSAEISVRKWVATGEQ